MQFDIPDSPPILPLKEAVTLADSILAKAGLAKYSALRIVLCKALREAFAAGVAAQIAKTRPEESSQ